MSNNCCSQFWTHTFSYIPCILNICLINFPLHTCCLLKLMDWPLSFVIYMIIPTACWIKCIIAVISPIQMHGSSYNSASFSLELAVINNIIIAFILQNIVVHNSLLIVNFCIIVVSLFATDTILNFWSWFYSLPVLIEEIVCASKV